MRGVQYTRSYRHSWWPPRPPWITLVLVSILLVHVANTSITCGPGIKSAGVTVPKGDIVLEYGGGVPLEITCILDPDNEQVRNLFRAGDGEPRVPSRRIIFYKNAERVSRQYVTAVNATAALLRIPDPPAGHDVYSCRLLLDSPQWRHGNHSAHGVTGVTRPLSSYPPAADEDDDNDDRQSVLSTVLPTSLETSGPPPLVPQDSEAGVCFNSVFVGYKPHEITNFSCISDNWVSLTCNWTKPVNPVKTKYKLYFRLGGRAGGRTSINCPSDSDDIENSCYWDFSTSPIYRQPYEYYYFTIIGENQLGNSSTAIRFHHYANVIPSSPTNITVEDKTQSSAMLRWSVGTMTSFPRELFHKIEYKSQWDSNPEHWHSVNVSDICNSSLTYNQTTQTSNSNCRERNTGYYFFNVTDLKYPFTHYDFRIYVRSSVARGEDKWSAPGCITLKTKPSIPRRPPRTDVGSFECATSPVGKSTRDVFVYWQNIDDSEKCGDQFEYRAYYTSTSSDNQTIIHRSNSTFKNYAKFDGLSSDVGYNITVYSANKEGLSADYSTIYVPSEANKLDEPLSFTKMAFDERGVFELSWKNASDRFSGTNQIHDYTIFWCENDKDRPYQCNGYMNWKHIPSTESCYNVTVSDHMKIYQFAISANGKIAQNNVFSSLYRPTSSSSGMVWASCTVLHNKIVGKIKNVWINMIGPTFMELRWKLDCSDRIGAVLGFRIFYCPVVSINNSNCKESMLNKTVGGEMAQDSRGIARVMNLKPYTTYMVTIALISKHGEGLHSDPLFNTTLEGAPDVQDLRINVLNITNTSVALTWSPPKFTNGVVRYYHVHYHLNDVHLLQSQQDEIESSDEQIVNEQRRITVTDTKCHLDHLESYRSYVISLTACTTVCSSRSFPTHVRTAVGLPGKVEQPTLLYENSTRLIVSWPRPARPAGPVDYYQLVVAHHSGLTNSQTTAGALTSPSALVSTQIQENSNQLYKSTSNNFRVPVPDCNDENDKGQTTFSFAVRAVNENPLDPNRPYYGPWSVPGSVSCMLPGLPLALHIVIWSCLFIVLSTVSTYWGNRFWKKYKIMHDVQVVLPPTLNINFKFDHLGGDSIDDNILDPDQHYFVEDGHIIYDTAPVNVISNVSFASDEPNHNSCAASTASDRLPQSRWSPATTTTTIMAMTDDDEPSGRQRPALPPPLTTTAKNSLGAAKTADNNDEDGDPPRPIEPVPLFFTLPDDTPTLPPPLPAARDRGVGVIRGVHQHGGGVVAVNGDPVNRLWAVRPDDGKTTTVTAIDCLVGDQQRSCDGDRLGRTPENDTEKPPPPVTGAENSREQEISHPSPPPLYCLDDQQPQLRLQPPQQLNLHLPQLTPKLQLPQLNQPMKLPQLDQPMKLPQLDQPMKLPQLDQPLRLQPQLSTPLQLKPQSQPCPNSLQLRLQLQTQPILKLHPQPHLCVQLPSQPEPQLPPQLLEPQSLQPQPHQRIQPATQFHPQTEPQPQPQQPQLQLQPQQQPQLQLQPQQPQLQLQPQQQPQLQLQPQPQQQTQHVLQHPQPQLKQSQQNRHDGYCGKQMMIAVAAAAAAAAAATSDTEQQQPPPPTASAPNAVVPESSTAYVMLDMMTAQKRLLDLQGRLEFTKPAVSVLPTSPSSASPTSSSVDAIGCGPAAAQRADTNVKVTT